MVLSCGLLLKYSFLTILLKAIICCSENITQPEVEISQGTLQGFTLTTRHGRNISGFLGIPYGQPPVGNLRFANPLPADDWNGTRDATVDGNVCMQLRVEELEPAGSSGEEDCLYLNVYTPKLPENTNSSLLPVMFYVFGGGFVSGDGSYRTIGPEFLLDSDVLLVIPNYRLGLLGFLSTGDEVASGNWGLKDLLLALQWVQKNIANFGGDPEQVTIFGISSGAKAVHILSLSNLTNGLFHKYITQSGSALAPWGWEPRSFAAQRAFQVGEYVDCFKNTTDSLIDCLRATNASDLIATTPNFVTVLRSVTTWMPTDEPNIEGAILTDNPANIYANGGARDLPWISGVTQDEGLLHTANFIVNDESFWEFMENIDTRLPKVMSWEYQPDGGAAWVNAVKRYYFNDDLTTNKSQLLANLTHLIGDGLFVYPAYKGLNIGMWPLVSTNSRYLYIFNYRGALSNTFTWTGTINDYGVSHGDDMYYLFQGNSESANLNQSMTESDYTMADSMVELWTTFAINGTITASCLKDTEWKPYSNGGSFLEIGNHSHVVFQSRDSFFEERMQFWEELTSGTSNNNAAGSIYNPNLFTVLVIFLMIFTTNTVI